MGTATPVPETRTMSGDELTADDAYAAMRRYGGRHLIRDAYVRFETLSQSQRGGGEQLALWPGLLTALVSPRIAMAQFERGANRIYGIERDHPFTARYGRALLMAVTAGLFMSVGFVILAGGGAVGTAVTEVYGWSGTTKSMWGLVCWPLGLLLAVLSISVLFRAAPRRRQPGHTWLAVGASERRPVGSGR